MLTSHVAPVATKRIQEAVNSISTAYGGVNLKDITYVGIK